MESSAEDCCPRNLKAENTFVLESGVTLTFARPQLGGAAIHAATNAWICTLEAGVTFAPSSQTSLSEAVFMSSQALKLSRGAYVQYVQNY